MISKFPNRVTLYFNNKRKENDKSSYFMNLLQPLCKMISNLIPNPDKTGMRQSCSQSVLISNNNFITTGGLLLLFYNKLHYRVTG